ncbi:MAG TPA: hypothetical protein VII69_11640 [Candidatus Eremiobacteraceae bacterium]
MAPPDIAMADNGDVAFVEHGPATQCGAEDGVIATGSIVNLASHTTSTVHETIGLNYGVVIVKANGRRSTIRRIPPLTFPRVLEIDFSITGLRLADDGTPFITLAEGAGTTREAEWVFSWSAAAWREQIMELPIRYGGPLNRRVDAVETPSRYSVVGDYREATQFSYEYHDRDPTYDMDEAGIVEDGKVAPLGFGDVTSMRGRYSAGYVAPYGWCAQTGAPTAVLWDGTKKKKLGPGVAFGVDADGDVVGDDRPPVNGQSNEQTGTDCIDGAHPTLWRHGKVVQLSKLRGSALAIRNGTIVGTVGVIAVCCVGPENKFASLTGGNAFVARARDEEHTFRYLDELARGDWTITSAFAIAASGRILAVGHPSESQVSSILILDPR